MCKKVITGALLGGLVLFVWQFAVHMLLVAQPRMLGTCLALALCFVVLVGVLPNWNWWGYSLAYIGGQIGELIVGWALVGLVLAKVMGGSSSSDG